MTTIKKYRLVILLNLILFSGCSVFYESLRVEVPKGFVGWCYVIPVKDKSVEPSPLENGKYLVDSSGVVLIPESEFDVSKSYVLKVYEDDVDISNDTRYAGSVYSSRSTDTIEYRYIHFFIPSQNERSIPDASEYWRDKHYEYTSSKYMKFDSLISARKIIF